MAVPDYWQVAGAILATSPEREMYIRDLTTRVINTQLTKLGRDGKTPWKTLQSDLGKRPEFRCRGNSCFRLCDEATKHPKIVAAAEAIRLAEQQRESARQIAALGDEVKSLKGKLATIAKLCK
jgi:hypothetical protein